MLLRALGISVLAGCALAQQSGTDVFDKAPPAIDQALRERVAKFFQAHVDGKFRLADEVVAEDSKEVFFAMEKKRYYSFEIAKIAYSENFTKATVVTALEMDWRSPRLGAMRVKPPATSLWKFVDGQWWWYVQPQKDWDTPWGRMTPGPDNKSPVLAAFKGVNPTQVITGVRADKNELQLSSYEPSTGEVTISNTMPGSVTLEVQYVKIPGLVATFDKTELKAGESARLTFKYEPPNRIPKETQIAQIKVQPTGQDLPVRITFAVPPEVLKIIRRQ